jgi:hypothetical protein
MTKKLMKKNKEGFEENKGGSSERDILSELKAGTYKPSISRLKKLMEDPMLFLDTSFTGNYYTRMGTGHESYLTFDKLPSNFAVVKGEEPGPFNPLMWSFVDALSFLIMQGGSYEESFEEAVDLSLYKQSETQVRKYFKKHQVWFLSMIEEIFDGKECITEDAFEVIKAMSIQYKKEPKLLKFLKGDFQFKVEFESNGWKCKGYLDRYDKDDKILVDFKTSKGDPLTVPRDQRYDLQGSFYNDGLIEMGFEVEKVIFIISQTIPPYKPHPIVMTKRDLEIGTNGGLFPSLVKQERYKNVIYKLVNEEVKGYTDLLDQLTWHVENGFDEKQPSSLFTKSNIW